MKKALWVVTYAVCSSVCANAQTIADVARRERAQKPPAQSAVAITNANLKKKAPNLTTEEKPAETPATTPAAGTAPATATTGAAAAAAAPQAAKPPVAATTDAQNEKGWREKFDAARTELRRAENQVAVAQLDLNNANRDYLTRSYDPGNRGLTAIGEKTQKLTDANKAVDSARAKIAQLEEDLRRAGAPPGWAR